MGEMTNNARECFLCTLCKLLEACLLVPNQEWMIVSLGFILVLCLQNTVLQASHNSFNFHLQMLIGFGANDPKNIWPHLVRKKAKQCFTLFFMMSKSQGECWVGFSILEDIIFPLIAKISQARPMCTEELLDLPQAQPWKMMLLILTCREIAAPAWCTMRKKIWHTQRFNAMVQCVMQRNILYATNDNTLKAKCRQMNWLWLSLEAHCRRFSVYVFQNIA